MRDFYLGLKFAFSYFTIFPIPFKKSDDLSNKKVLSAMLFFFPLVGLILGFMTIMIASFGLWLSALIASILYMALYGFIHTEAVCDVADALYAKHSGKDAFAIIKESTIGAMGLFYGLAFFTVKVGAMVALFLEGKYVEFIAVLLISRLALLVLIKVLPFKSGFVNMLKEALDNRYLLASFLLFSLVGIGLIGSEFLFFLIFGGILAYIIARFIGAKLGFINGDVLGVTLESVEIILLLIIGVYNVV